MKAKSLVLWLVVAGLLISGCARLRRGLPGKGRVMITYFSPQGAMDKPMDMEIRFSGPVAKPENVGKDLDPSVISINPNLEKTCSWHDQSTVRCYLRGQGPEVLYKVEVQKSIIPKESRLKLVANRKFKFSMAALRVMGIQTKFLTYTDPPKYGITVIFNQEVDRSEVESHLKVTAPDGKTLPYTITGWQPSTDQFQIETYLGGYVKFKWNYITVSIIPGMPNKARNSKLKDPYSDRIDLPQKGDLKVVSSQMIQRENLSFIQVCFSSSVPSENLKANMTMNPALDFRIENEGNCSNILAAFEPDKSYTITINKDLTSSLDESMPNEFKDTVQMADLKPKISLAGSGHYLPRKGAMNLGLETINTDKVYIRVKKIYANNLVYFLGGGRGEYYCGGYYDEESNEYQNSSGDECKLKENLEVLGKQTLEKEQPVATAKNKIVTTTLALEDLVGKDRSGIYAVGIYKNKDEWYANAFAWMIATDLGILAQKSDDQLIVMVRSLETLEPQAGVKVKLLSKNNQLMAEQTTDGQGIARFPKLAETFKQFVPFLILAEKGDDFSFLSFDQAGLNISSFDVSGDSYASTSYEAYLYPERDLYRPGETAHVAYLIRDTNLGLPASFPVTLKVTTPDNRLFKILKSQPDELLSGEFSVDFPREILTGSYNFSLYGPEDQPIGSTQVKAEEFIPDRIKVAMITDKSRYLAGEPISASIKANYLFGPPVAKQRAVGNCYIEERPMAFPAYDEFSFADQLQKRLEPISLSLGEQQTDDKGEGTFTCDIPSNLRPYSGGLTATLQASVFEAGGGRAVTAGKVLDVDPYEVYLGIRQDFKGQPAPNNEIKFSVIALDNAGKPAPGRELVVQFYKMEWHSVLKLVNNHYEYVSEVKQESGGEKKITSAQSPVQVSFTSPSYGDFAIAVEDTKSSARSSREFYIWGWGYAPWAMQHPDRIELTLDKKDYLPGEEAKVLVKAPFSGKLIVMVLGNQMLDYKEYSLSENTATIKIPVRDDFKPNAYAVFTLLRSFKNTEKFAPLRAVGVVPIKLNSSPRKLEVKVTAPQKIRPNTALTVDIEVPGAPGGKVSLAAVDEGILQLSGFSSPDPLSFYYRKRRLDYDLFDIYSMILPEIVPVAPRSPFGGEISRAKLKRELAPLSAKRVKPVSLWSGLIKLDGSGKARVKFDIPQFNGTLRLMAVSFSRDKMGMAENSLIVREPITINSSLPRFLAPGDKFVIPVTIFNGTGKKGDFTASIETLGKVKLAAKSQKTAIDKDADTTLKFEAEAVPAIGTDKVVIRASGNSEESSEITEIAIRPAYPLYAKTDVVSVTASQPGTFQFPSNFVAGTTEFKIAVSGLPSLKYAESLKYLVHYPYGCIEQTTSSAFPLLYFNDLAKLALPQFSNRTAVDYFVNEAIEKLVSMNRADGSFSFWPDGGYQADPWSSAYATHYLLEAKKAGYNVPDIILQRSLDYLWNVANTQEAKDFWRCEQNSYILYVLALGNRPNSGEMDRMLKDGYCVNLDMESRTLLAGAYAYKGDMQTANKLFLTAVKPITEKRGLGTTFYTPARAYALTLSVMVDKVPSSPALPGLVKLLSDAGVRDNFGWHWSNTQENVFGLMALGKFYRSQAKADFKGTITVGKKTKLDFDPAGTTVAAADWGGEKVDVKLTGNGTAFVYWEASGIPTTPPEIKPESLGIGLVRDYLDESGQPISLDNIPQGSVVIVRIKLRAADQQLENVVMVDMLPAGLEIENPRLLTTAKPQWIQEKTSKPDYMDIRDDRMITFQTVSNYSLPKDYGSFYYATRAVTAGTFVLPPVKAESMYDPSYRAITAPGKITIVERK